VFVRALQRVLPFLTAVLTTACVTPDETIDIVHDACQPIAILAGDGATDEERASAAEGMEMWNALAGTRLTGVAEAGAAIVPLEFRLAAAAFFGTYDDETGQIIVNRRLSDARERAVTIAHEIGHAMGLIHVDEDVRLSVMNPANVQITPTREDRAVLVAAWGECPAD
jgi:hypothetical protein